MAFVFEGDLDLGAVKLNLAVADSHVLRHDLRYAQLAQMFSGLLNHVLGSAFPAFGASADEFDNVVNALGMDNLVTTLGHERISSSTNTLPPSTDPTPKMTFCPAERRRSIASGFLCQREGAQLHPRCSSKKHEPFSTDEHLQGRGLL